jgi:hypothetical protein
MQNDIDPFEFKLSPVNTSSIDLILADQREPLGLTCL